MNKFCKHLEFHVGTNAPKRHQDKPNKSTKGFKEPKTSMYKNVVFAWNIQQFLILKNPKRASRSPRDAPETPKEFQHPTK